MSGRCTSTTAAANDTFDLTVNAGAGADTVRVNTAALRTVTVNGDAGNDKLSGGLGNDTLLFFGSNIGETIAVSEDGDGFDIFRNIASVTLDVDDVEDLRVAVNELFTLLVDDSEDPSGVVELTYVEMEGAVSVTGSRQLDGSAPPVSGPEDLALEILRVVVDEHEFTSDGDRRTFSLLKRLPAAPA